MVGQLESTEKQSEPGNGLVGPEPHMDSPMINDDVVELLAFTMSEQFFAVDIMMVREIRGWTHPTPLPHAPECMMGVINLRGTVLPIIDLSQRLGNGPTDANARNVIIVVEVGSHLAGLLVDAVSDILTLNTSSFQPPPEMPGQSGTAFVDALSIVDEEMVRIIDLEALLEATEGHAIA